MKLDSKPGAAALLLSTVVLAEAELPEAELEAELEAGVAEAVLFEGTFEGLSVAVAEVVEEAVSDDVDVVFVVLDESKSDASKLPTE